MANRNDNNTTGRTAAIVGGSALLLWLLLRGKGSGLGGHGSDVGSVAATTATAAGAASPRPPPCRVRIDADGIQLDGVPADLATTIGACRVAGSADLRATGAAITGVIADVVHALLDAGVQVYATTDVWGAAHSVPVRRPQ